MAGSRCRRTRSAPKIGLPWIIEHVAKEIEGLENEQAHAVESHLANLQLHLLKWRDRSDKRGESWPSSIGNARDETADHLEWNPSLRS
jgi:hypothetical protein